MNKQTHYKIISLMNLKIQFMIELEINTDISEQEVKELAHKINKIEKIINKLKNK